MTITYIEAIGLGFPDVCCHTAGSNNLYSELVWDSGADIPAQQTLDEWIAANSNTQNAVTKYAFRKLFSLTERVAIDNFENSTSLTDGQKALLKTVLKDLELSGEVQLFNPDVTAGVTLVEQMGLIAAGRAAEILSNTPPVE